MCKPQLQVLVVAIACFGGRVRRVQRFWLEQSLCWCKPGHSIKQWANHKPKPTTQNSTTTMLTASQWSPQKTWACSGGCMVCTKEAGWMWRGPANFLAYMTGTELPSLCWTHGRWKGLPLLLHSALPPPKSRSGAQLMATIVSVEALWNHHVRNLLSPSSIAGAYYVEGGTVILALGVSCVFVLIRLIQ